MVVFLRIRIDSGSSVNTCGKEAMMILSTFGLLHYYDHGLLNTWTAIFPRTEKIPDANISISNIDTFHVQRLYNYFN